MMPTTHATALTTFRRPVIAIVVARLLEIDAFEA